MAVRSVDPHGWNAERGNCRSVGSGWQGHSATSLMRRWPGANLISATRSMGLKWNVNDSFIEEFKHTVNRVLSQSIISCGCQKAYDMVEHISRHRIDGRRSFFVGDSFFLAKRGTGQ